MKCNRKKKYEADALACERMQETVEPLVEWFRENQRDLPWRKHVNAYRVWISEIMLQQTRVEAVKSYYTRFLKELPDIKALAARFCILRTMWRIRYIDKMRSILEMPGCCTTPQSKRPVLSSQLNASTRKVPVFYYLIL